MTCELATGEHEVPEKEPGVRCDQCHADSGFKRKSKKTFNKAEVKDAEFEVTLNGAKMKLCKEHHAGLERTLNRHKGTHDFVSRTL